MLYFVLITLQDCRRDGDKINCSGFGTCENDTCNCKQPHTGTYCDECQDGFILSTDGLLRCVNVAGCITSERECSGHGYCEASKNNEYKCRCINHYNGQMCNRCLSGYSETEPTGDITQHPIHQKCIPKVCFSGSSAWAMLSNNSDIIMSDNIVYVNTSTEEDTIYETVLNTFGTIQGPQNVLDRNDILKILGTILTAIIPLENISAYSSDTYVSECSNAGYCFNLLTGKTVIDAAIQRIIATINERLNINLRAQGCACYTRYMNELCSDCQTGYRKLLQTQEEEESDDTSFSCVLDLCGDCGGVGTCNYVYTRNSYVCTCPDGKDPEQKCTTCLTGRDPSQNCTICLPGYDIKSGCVFCSFGRDAATNCTTCLPGFTGPDCYNCTLGRDPFSRCTTCPVGQIQGTDGYCMHATAGGVFGIVFGIIAGIAILIGVIIGIVICIRQRKKGYVRVNQSASDVVVD